MRDSGIAALRTATLVLLCLLLALGAAAASIADAFDGDEDFALDVAGGEPPVLPVRPTSSLPPPSETARLNAPDPVARPPHAPVPQPTSLRAPPSR